MDATETLARQMARQYACHLAAYCNQVGLLPLPETKAKWDRALNQYVEDYWWDFLERAEKINEQPVVAAYG